MLQGAAVPPVLDRTASWPRCRRRCAALAVLDRTKEPGAVGEPLYLDVVTALREAREEGVHAPDADGRRRPLRPVVEGIHAGDGQGGLRRAGAGPAEESLHRRHHRRRDAHRRSPATPTFDIEPDDVVRAVFYGLGADGTVGANKNSIKIIGEETDHYAQGYFVYDSKKSGAITISHLRFGPRPIRSPYLIRRPTSSPATSSSSSTSIDVLEHAARRRGLPAERALRRRTRSGTSCRARCRSRSSRRSCASSSSTRYEVARETGMGGAHQHDHADLLLRHLRRAAARRGDRADQERDREDLRQARRRRWCGGTSRRWTPRWPTCTRCRCRPRRPPTRHRPPLVSAERARLRAEGHGA